MLFVVDMRRLGLAVLVLEWSVVPGVCCSHTEFCTVDCFGSESNEYDCGASLSRRRVVQMPDRLADIDVFFHSNFLN